jgi:hypothetical protein
VGYLDGSAIAVDAVLTKQGRKLLANGLPLGINQFCLSDTGIDYNLWNPDHLSGSAYYGEAIEALPQTEALSLGHLETRNKLVTLPRNTTAMPICNVLKPEAFKTGDNVLPSANVRTWEIVTYNFHDPDEWWLITDNRHLLSPVGGDRFEDISGTGGVFVQQADIEQAGMLTITQTGDGKGYFKARPGITNVGQYITLTFVSKMTGAWTAHTNLFIPESTTSIDVTEV